MNLTERLQEAAERRRNEAPPLTTIEVGRRREPTGPVEVAPLPAPAQAGPEVAAPTLAAPLRAEIDLRATEASTDTRTCPRCAEPARLDINDRTRGVLHLSCDSCFKMWQVAVTPSGTA